MSRDEIIEMLSNRYDNLDLLGIIKDCLNIVINDIEYMNDLREEDDDYDLGNNYRIECEDLESLVSIIDTINSIKKYNEREIEGVIEEREEEDNNVDDENNYCDEYFEEEQVHYEKIGVSVNDTMDGIEISVIGDTDILETYRIKMNMTRYSKMDLYNITKEVARRLTMYYYQTSANLPTLVQVEDMIKDELLK